jgi:hypothetical protein
MKKILIVLLITILVVSCNDYLDVNTDPTRPTSVNPELTLPVAEVFSARGLKDWGGTRMYNTFGNMMMYNWSQTDGFSWYTDEFNYLVNTNFYSSLYNVTYSRILKEYQVLLNYEGSEYDNYKAIAKIMQSYHFQMLVDTYGDIPYTEALKRGELPFPKFDKAEDVYDGLITELSDAIDLIDNATANDDSKTPGADDVIFAGNMTSWKQLANTIKMRILIRQSGMAAKQGFIQAEFNKIAAEGSGFIGADAAVNAPYENATNKQNPFWARYGMTPDGNQVMNGDATCATDYIITYLQATNDPRLDFIYEKPDSGHQGVPQGLEAYPTDDSMTAPFVSNIGPGLLKAYNQAAVFFPLSESFFLQAEAIEHGYMGGNSKEMYESGISASFAYLGVANASAYYSNGISLVDWSATADKMEAIITQKWIALNGINGFESWVEYNRTGFPLNLPNPIGATTDRPVRLYYPSSEITANGSNVPTQQDAFSAKIFWAN